MNLYYEVSGNGKPIVFIHSGGADLREWTYLAPLLSQRYQAITYDGRGAGISPDPTGDVSCVEDVKSLLDHLEIKKATVVGRSMGGQIATDFALEYPERVDKLILLAPALTGFPYSDQFIEYMNSITAAAPDIDQMIEVSQSAPLYRVVQASPQRELTEKMLRHHIQRTFNWPSFELIWPEPPAFERLAELKPDTLFLIGTEESADSLRVKEYFRECTNAQIISISGADHMLTLTHPHKLYQQMTKFMER